MLLLYSLAGTDDPDLPEKHQLFITLHPHIKVEMIHLTLDLGMKETLNDERKNYEKSL